MEFAGNLITKLLRYLRRLCDMMMLFPLPLELIKSINNCLTKVQLADFACL
jgi:hypothetical protein